MSTKASNPRCKINFGNITFRILTLQTTWVWVFLHDFGTKSKFSFGILILQTTLFTVYLHDLGTRSRFNFRILILQTSWFTAYLHDLGTKSRFNFWILILQKKGWNKCLQKPLIHDAKLILEILLFGPWSSKLPSFECFCMFLELGPDSALLSLSSKLPGFQRICMISGLNPGSVLGSWSFKKSRMKQMSTKASSPRCKNNFGNLTFRTLILQTT